MVQTNCLSLITYIFNCLVMLSDDFIFVNNNRQWARVFSYSFSTTTLQRFLQNAIPYARISSRPSSRNSVSYLRFLICSIALSQALSRSLMECAYFNSITIPTSGFLGLSRISANPSLI